MKIKVKRAAIVVAVFVLIVVLYRLLWTYLRQDVLNRLGYDIWLRWAAEKSINLIRVNILKGYFEFAFPFLLASVGAYWLSRLIKRTRLWYR